MANPIRYPLKLSLAVIICACGGGNTRSSMSTTTTASDDSTGTDATTDGIASESSASASSTNPDATSTASTAAESTTGSSGTTIDSTAGQDNTTSTGVPAPECGNGVVEGEEQCDDGNDDNTDACVAGCNNAVCGDHFVQEGKEECDEGVEGKVFADKHVRCQNVVQSMPCHFRCTTIPNGGGAFYELCEGDDIAIHGCMCEPE